MDALSAYLATQPVFSATNLTRLIVAGHAVGWLEPATVDFLTQYTSQFKHVDKLLQLTPTWNDTHATLLTDAALAMRDAGLIRGWRNELYTCYAPTADGNLDRQQPLFQLERAAFRRFGLTSRAVHINGYTADGRLWIGHRAANKSIDPGKLDNLAAGGLPTGEMLFDCVIRELWEEAGVTAQLARQARQIDTIRTTRNETDGTHDEIIYSFDLLLPADFVPRNIDGEVAGFTAMTVEQTIAALHDFTWDAGAVTADFLRRRG